MAVAPNLTELPSDILLYISQQFGLEDAVSFSMISTVFQALAQQRGYWITVLKKARRLRPIACISHEDLSQKSLESLKHVVFHTLRRDRNFELPEPRILGPVKSVLLEETHLDVIFHVPGTELCVMHSRFWRAAVCWDIGLGKAVSPQLDIPARIKDVSPGEDRPGQFSMGLLLEVNDGTTGEVFDWLLVICLRYGKRSEIVLEQTFFQKFSSTYDHWAVFMNEEIIGVLRTAIPLPQSPKIEVLAFNRSSTERTAIQTGIPLDEPSRSGHSGTSSFGRDVFILIEHREASRCYRCPADLLPYNGRSLPSTSESNLRCIDNGPIAVPDSYQCIQMGALSAEPYYGVPAVSLHGIAMEESDVALIRVRFWTRSDKENPDIPYPSLVLKCEVDVHGTLWDSEVTTWQLMLIPHSGLQVMLVVYHENAVKLQLVQFHPDSGSASVHLLPVPSFIDMHRIYGLALDDHRGVVSLLDRRGFLFVIPYA